MSETHSTPKMDDSVLPQPSSPRSDASGYYDADIAALRMKNDIYPNREPRVPPYIMNPYAYALGACEVRLLAHKDCVRSIRNAVLDCHDPELLALVESALSRYDIRLEL